MSTSDDFNDLLDALDIVDTSSARKALRGKDNVEKRIERLRDLLKEINKTIDVDLIINITIDHIADAHSECALFLKDAESNVYCKISRDMPEKVIADLRRHIDEAYHSLDIENIRFQEYSSASLVYHLYPLISNNELYGFLALGNSPKQVPDALEQDFAVILSAQLAILIEKSILYHTITSSQDKLDIKMEELQALYDELLTLYDFSQASSSMFELQDMLQLALEKAHKTVEAEKTLVLTQEQSAGRQSEKNSTLSVQSRIGWREDELPAIINTEGTVLESVIRDKKELVVNNFFEDERCTRLKRTGLETKDMLIVPIMVHGEIFGIIITGNRVSNKPYSPQHQRLISSMASQTGKSIENIRLYAEYVEKQKIQRDLDVAHDIQTSLLPDHAPHFDSLEICGYSQPAREVGGDFFDYIKLPDNQIGVSVGDVSGKGIPAALLMAMTKSVLRSEASSDRDLSSAFFRFNNIISHDMISGKFITIIYAVFDYIRGTVRFVSAGHHPPLIYRASEDLFETVNAEGLPIGIIENSFFEEQNFSLNTNDIVLLFTDGILEAMSESDQEYGMERLKSVIRNNSGLALEELKQAILADVALHMGKAPLHDDTTLVILRYREKHEGGRSIMKKFTIVSELPRLDRVLHEVADDLYSLDAPEEVVCEVKLTADSFINSVLQGRKRVGPESKIAIHYELHPGDLSLHMKEEGSDTDVERKEIFVRKNWKN